MSLRKPFAAAAAITAAFAIGLTATNANAATAPIIPPVTMGVPTTMPMIPALPIGIPTFLSCAAWYGLPNPADVFCAPWWYYRYDGGFPIYP